MATTAQRARPVRRAQRVQQAQPAQQARTALMERTARQARLARVEQLKKFRMLPKELDHEDGELTATQKVKRAAVSKLFADLVDDMYSSKA